MDSWNRTDERERQEQWGQGQQSQWQQGQSQQGQSQQGQWQQGQPEQWNQGQWGQSRHWERPQYGDQEGHWYQGHQGRQQSQWSQPQRRDQGQWNRWDQGGQWDQGRRWDQEGRWYPGNQWSQGSQWNQGGIRNTLSRLNPFSRSRHQSRSQGWGYGDQAMRVSVGKQEIGADKLERGISMLAGGALLMMGVRRPSLMGFTSAVIGGALLARGMTGRMLMVEPPSARGDRSGYGPMPMRVQHHRQPLAVRHTITVDRPVEEVYRYWRNLENLPRFMKHVESVQSRGEISHWRVNLAPGMVFEWDARLSSDVPNELIAWQTLPGSPVDHTGTVKFNPTGDYRSTVVEVSLAYYPPAGMLGQAIAKLEKGITEQQIVEDMRRFKQMLETGEVATTEGQPQGA